MSSILECTSASGPRVSKAYNCAVARFPADARAHDRSERARHSGARFGGVQLGLKGMWYVHAPRASGDPPALLQALELALAGVLGLALHEIIIVVLAPGADEEGS